MEIVANDFLTRLRAFVRRRVPSTADADDVVQTVLVRLLETGSDKELDSTLGWVLTTARTVIADLHRSRSTAGSAVELEQIACPEAEDQRDITGCLTPLLATLEPDDRSVLERVDMADESQTRLAGEYGLTATAMKSRVQRARARLRSAITARCQVEFDAFGAPTGDVVCKPSSGDDCGCAPA